MKFGFFNSVKAQRGELCTYEKFLEVSHSPVVAQICAAIAREPDHEKQQQMKKELPVITFNAHFEGQRKNELAIPSGAYMVDLDGVDTPSQFYSKHIAGRLKELGIVYVGETPSRHGLRIVAKCRPEFTTIAECQQWMSDQVGWPCDAACKDWARSSYVVPDSYWYHIDAKGMFVDEPEVVYEVKAQSVQRQDAPTVQKETSEVHEQTAPTPTLSTFKGIPLNTIAIEWLRMTGGEPVEGERNSRLFDCAKVLRHITDFNEAALLTALPTYGLPDSEMRSLVHSACISPRGGRPKELDELLSRIAATPDGDTDIVTTPSLNTDELPPLPPLFREFVKIAPPDFKQAVTLCALPLVGTLGSKLRAYYLDGNLHSPSFQVSLEAPQASGKSFMTRLSHRVLAPLLARDNDGYQVEREYNENSRALGSKLTAEQRKEMLGPIPKNIIRCIPPTISSTKMLMRMENARGLHLVAISEEIDTVTKALSNRVSNYSDALRIAFDNGFHGQDYASDNSWSGRIQLFYNTLFSGTPKQMCKFSENSYSGIIPLYYNTLFSGTPKAMRRFYPDVEDGLVSRVLFVTLPDQFGKPMPVWGELSNKDRKEVEEQIRRLNEVSIVGDVVQPDHVMNLDFLNRAMDLWLKEQQKEAVNTGDRTRDTFCRRAAVVGFRAGMLAWFLWDEKGTPTIRKNVCQFATWVANSMLNQHLLRFQVEGTGSNINRWESVLKALPEEFTRAQIEQQLSAQNVDTPVRTVVYQWKLAGFVEEVAEGRLANGRKGAVRFRKKV